MGLRTELQEIARASFKNSVLDKSLSISPTTDLLDDPNPDQEV